MSKIIICDGDSWTAGHMINPELEHRDDIFINHVENESYRLPKVWPHKLGKYLDDVIIENNAHAGSSNDGIVRRVMRRVTSLLKEKKPEDLFVIIGFTSPERKDFFYKSSNRKAWDTLYPAQYEQDFDFDESGELKLFYKTYGKVFWNAEEYLERYTQQIILLHNFFKNNNVKHLFFDAFYETADDDMGLIFNSINIDDVLIELGYDTKSHYHYSEYILNIRKEVFMTKSFRNTILDEMKNNKILRLDENKYYNDSHPSETSQEMWANKLLPIVRRKFSD